MSIYTKAAAWASSAHLPTYESRSGFQDGPETNMKQMWCLFYVNYHLPARELSGGPALIGTRRLWRIRGTLPGLHKLFIGKKVSAVRLHSVTRPSGPKGRNESHPVRFISGDLIWQIVTSAQLIPSPSHRVTTFSVPRSVYILGVVLNNTAKSKLKFRMTARGSWHSLNNAGTRKVLTPEEF